MNNKAFYLVAGIILLASCAFAYLVSDDGSGKKPTQQRPAPSVNTEIKL